MGGMEIAKEFAVIARAVQTETEVGCNISMKIMRKTIYIVRLAVLGLVCSPAADRRTRRRCRRW